LAIYVNFSFYITWYLVPSFFNTWLFYSNVYVVLPLISTLSVLLEVFIVFVNPNVLADATKKFA
jgi:hypothetical protein